MTLTGTPIKKGHLFWEFIVKQKAGLVGFGVCASPFSHNMVWIVRSDGIACRHDGSIRPYGKRWQQDDLIGLELDTSTGQLCCYVNGAHQGVAHTLPKLNGDGAKDPTGYIPCAALSRQGDAVELLGLKQGPGIQVFEHPLRQLWWLSHWHNGSRKGAGLRVQWTRQRGCMESSKHVTLAVRKREIGSFGS